MASFFEKLKKGMGAEIPETEEAKEEAKNKKLEELIKKPIEKEKPKKRGRKPKVSLKKKAVVSISAQEKTKETEEKPIPEKEALTEEKTDKESKAPAEKWSAFSGEPEGQLAIDVYQTEDELVVQSAIAGIKPEDLDVSIEGDVVTIRGVREKPDDDEEKNYFYQECYWGPFSRELILSEEVDPTRATAEMKEGILTIKIPRIQRQKKRKITVKV